MSSGRLFSMTNSLMPTDTAQSSPAMMAYRGAFTHASLLILPIIPKSTSQLPTPSAKVYSLIPRVLFASIRNKGASPCPRCLISLHNVQNLGQARDRHQRITLQRVADKVYQKKITSARAWVYGPKNKGVKSKFVEDILKLDSLVPTSVGLGYTQ